MLSTSQLMYSARVFQSSASRNRTLGGLQMNTVFALQMDKEEFAILTNESRIS